VHDDNYLQKTSRTTTLYKGHHALYKKYFCKGICPASISSILDWCYSPYESCGKGLLFLNILYSPLHFTFENLALLQTLCIYSVHCGTCILIAVFYYFKKSIIIPWRISLWLLFRMTEEKMIFSVVFLFFLFISTLGYLSFCVFLPLFYCEILSIYVGAQSFINSLKGIVIKPFELCIHFCTNCCGYIGVEGNKWLHMR
jgi:hypothetical protein